MSRKKPETPRCTGATVAGTLTPSLGHELNIKRFYLPGLVITATCPGCSRTLEWNGDIQYLSFPLVNEPFDERMYCEDCEEADRESNPVVRLILRVGLEVVPS